MPLNPCFVFNGKNMRQKSFGNFQDNKRVASDVSLLPTMLALVWSPPWMTSLNEHLQSSFAFICILQCTDVPTLPSMTVGFFHFSYRNDHFHFLTVINTNSIIFASSQTSDRRGLQSATAFQTVWITIFTSDFPPHRPPHHHPYHVYHHFDHHLPNHHLLHHHHPHLSWASSLFKGNPLFPSQLRRLQDELQPKFYFSSSLSLQF